MTALQADEFMTKLLQGAFDKWQPSSYWWSFWRKKLENLDAYEAKAALAMYAENKTKTEDEPTWARYQEYLKKVAVKPSQQDNGLEVYLIAQCYSHRIPACIGAILYGRYSGAREQQAVENYQIELARGKGGFWQAYIAYGLAGLRDARKDMISKRNAAINYFLNNGYRKYSMDFQKELERDYYLDELLPEYMPVSQPDKQKQDATIEDLVF